MQSQNPATITFSLVIPVLQDRDAFNARVDNVCSVLDDQIPGCYEIVAVETHEDNSPVENWEHVRGEILIIIDGDLSYIPTTLADIVVAFNEGSDMTFAEQYEKDRGLKNEPDLKYFGIKRSCLPRLHESPEGQRLILEILGPETIKKLGSPATETSESYILKSLKKIIDIRR